jgi:hypothetical protein
MSPKAVVGIYDSLAKAEEAELVLEGVYLPVGQMSLVAPKLEDGKVEGGITARDVAKAIAGTGIRLARDQMTEYEQALDEGKLLLFFYGDGNQVAQAYQALGNTDHDDLTLLGG